MRTIAAARRAVLGRVAGDVHLRVEGQHVRRKLSTDSTTAEAAARRQS